MTSEKSGLTEQLPRALLLPRSADNVKVERVAGARDKVLLELDHPLTRARIVVGGRERLEHETLCRGLDGWSVLRRGERRLGLTAAASNNVRKA